MRSGHQRLQLGDEAIGELLAGGELVVMYAGSPQHLGVDREDLLM
jgi:malate/lactate dehydrogenase